MPRGRRPLHWRPVYYGLLFAHLLGTGRLLPVSASSATNLAAHAIRTTGGQIRVLIENLADRAETISLHAGTVSGEATALRLTAPSPEATSDVTPDTLCDCLSHAASPPFAYCTNPTRKTRRFRFT